VNANPSTNGDIVVITGSAAGIGRCLLDHFLAAGSLVVAVDAAAAELEKIEAEYPATHLRAFAADVRDQARAIEVLGAVKREWGTPQVLINNAAIVRHALTADCSPELWREIIDINLTGSFIWASEIGKEMMGAGYGRIINMASHAGLFGTVGRGAYSASKAGVISLTKTLAVELAQYGITANAVAPGPVETPKNTKTHTQQRRQAWAEGIPLKRYAAMEEIVSLVAFLASRDSAYITGQTIAVDGGFSIAGLLADA
jgi:NAD(P)-dependent dehydrogenase (short-subunit alcohol dehydrogenase family)